MVEIKSRAEIIGILALHTILSFIGFIVFNIATTPGAKEKLLANTADPKDAYELLHVGYTVLTDDGKILVDNNTGNIYYELSYKDDDADNISAIYNADGTIRKLYEIDIKDSNDFRSYFDIKEIKGYNREIYVDMNTDVIYMIDAAYSNSSGYSMHPIFDADGTLRTVDEVPELKEIIAEEENQ